MFINFAQGFVLPPFWLNHPEGIKKMDADTFDAASRNPAAMKGTYTQCPLHIKFHDEGDEAWWRLPFDPVISVSGGNNITLTNVLKQDNGNNARRGSIKEVWAQKDYEIQIAGVFISDSADDALPDVDLTKLRTYCEARKIVDVNCSLLQIFGIQRMAIVDYEFAHTAGIRNQQFSIKAYSDDDFSLFVK